MKVKRLFYMDDNEGQSPYPNIGVYHILGTDDILIHNEDWDEKVKITDFIERIESCELGDMWCSKNTTEDIEFDENAISIFSNTEFKKYGLDFSCPLKSSTTELSKNEVVEIMDSKISKIFCFAYKKAYYSHFDGGVVVDTFINWFISKPIGTKDFEFEKKYNYHEYLDKFLTFHLKKYPLDEYGKTWIAYNNYPNEEPKLQVKNNTRLVIDKSGVKDVTTADEIDNIENIEKIYRYNNIEEEWELIQHNISPYIEKIRTLQNKIFNIVEWYPTRTSRSGKTVYESNNNGHRLIQLYCMLDMFYDIRQYDDVEFYKKKLKENPTEENKKDFIREFTYYNCQCFNYFKTFNDNDIEIYYKNLKEDIDLLKSLGVNKIDIGKDSTIKHNKFTLGK